MQGKRGDKHPKEMLFTWSWECKLLIPKKISLRRRHGGGSNVNRRTACHHGDGKAGAAFGKILVDGGLRVKDANVI